MKDEVQAKLAAASGGLPQPVDRYQHRAVTVLPLTQERTTRLAAGHSRCQNVAKANRSVWGIGAKVLKATAHN